MPSVSAVSLLKAIQYLPTEDRLRVEHAFSKADAWHSGQLRDSGDPYIVHPLAVTEYLATLEAARDTLIAALLHDVVEDGCTTLEEVEEGFGKEVALLVDGVTKLSKFHYEGKRAERQLASLRKMLLTASDDLRVIFIKLADRWHNVQSLSALRADKQKRIARETLDIYVPFARLVGLWELKGLLEDTCFPIAYPEESEEWSRSVTEARDALRIERKSFIDRINAETTEDVEARMDIMTDYELYKKLHGSVQRLRETRHLDSALLVLQQEGATNTDCYETLGEIHERYLVQSNSFSDYISAVQPNGYRALHTTIFLSQNHKLRLRIQTKVMYEYASKRKLSDWVTDRGNDTYKALASLGASKEEGDGYLQDLRENVLEKRMNVFTTSGEIVALPKDATGIDFAFAINPDHLSYLSGVRVNGETQPPSVQLESGDLVELVLHDREGDNGNSEEEIRSLWLDKVKSVDAREGLKESLKKTPEKQQEDDGKAILDRELSKRNLPSWTIFRIRGMQKRLAHKMGMNQFSHVLQKIGTGEISVSSVIEACSELLTTESNWLIKLLSVFQLLPRQRVLDPTAQIFKIEVYAEDRKGLIHDITKCIANKDINIARFSVFAVPPSGALYRISLEAKNFEEFSKLFDSLLEVPNVKKILRK